jgi:hypothetical protein
MANSPDLGISIEKFDEVAFEKNRDPVALIQTKHHVNGIYDDIPWQYMNYENAVKLGQKQLDEEKARNKQPNQPNPTWQRLLATTNS